MALSKRVELDPDLCLNIVKNATPYPDRFKEPDQDLFELGVVDKDQAQKHRSKIQSALSKMDYQIAQGEIQSGPGVAVGDSSDSVLGHAH